MGVIKADNGQYLHIPCEAAEKPAVYCDAGREFRPPPANRSDSAALQKPSLRALSPAEASTSPRIFTQHLFDLASGSTIPLFCGRTVSQVLA